MIGTIFNALWARIFAGIAAVFFLGFVTQTIRIEGFWFVVGFKEKNAILRIDLSKIKAEREQERAAYQAAQADAEAREQERLTRVTSQQMEITDEIRKEYSDKLAAVRARAERLRKQAPARVAGSPGNQQMPCPPEAAGRVDDPACDYGLSLDERLIATEQALRLEALQSWVKDQTRVSVN